MVENEVGHSTDAEHLSAVSITPELPGKTDLDRLLAAQDLRVGMVLHDYEVPRG